MQQFAQFIIYIHAFLGFIGLFFGTLVLVLKKGTRRHVLLGSIFFWALFVSSLLAIVTSTLPGHKSFFLGLIGWFSAYLILSGKRVIHYKNDITKVGLLDRVVTASMFVSGVLMVGFSLYFLSEGRGEGVVFIVFGSLGLWQSLGDFVFFRKGGNAWLSRHLGKMLGGYIAALTAFIVVNGIIPGIMGWLSPTILGLLYGVLAGRKLGRQRNI